MTRRDIDHPAPSTCADLALLALHTLAFAGGAVHDPAASLLLCARPGAAHTVFNGRVGVRESQIANVKLGPQVAQHNQLALELATGGT